MAESANVAKGPRGWAWPVAAILAAAGLAGLLYVLFSASSKPAAFGFARYANGAMQNLTVLEAPPPRPGITLYDGEGAPTSLAALGEGPMVVNVWATWCPPCLQEMPTIAALSKAYKDKGLTVVAVSVDGPEKAAQARDLLQELSGGELPFLIEPSRELGFALRTQGMPITVLYDAQGQEVARLLGGADWASPAASRLMDALLEAAPAGQAT